MRLTAVLGVVPKPVPNFTRLDAGRPDVAVLITAEVVAFRSLSSSDRMVCVGSILRW
jgi:hypothetical protein